MISIVIPIYNRAHLIVETLNSIHAQTYTNWECILVDDGSTDNLEDVVTPFLEKSNKFKFYKRPIENKKGASSCRNYGFSLMKGDYLQFFDSDDIMHPEHLQEKIKVFKNDLDFVFCRTQSFVKDYKEARFLPMSTATFSGDLFQDFVLGNISMQMLAPLWRHSFLVKNVPLLDENITLNEDMELHSRLLFTKPKYQFVDHCLIFVRTGLNSITNTYLNKPSVYIDDFLEVKKRILKLDPINTEINLGIMKLVLREFRACMANKDYSNSLKILNFIKSNNINQELKNKIIRITIAFKIIKILGFGETRFKSFLKF